MTAAPKSGLGRGLAAILPTAESSERAQLSAQDRVLHSLVESGLDQLAALGPLDLLAYLHLPRHDEPVLFLRRPELATLSPTRAYRLFARFVQASRAGTNEGTFTQDGTVTVFLRTPGPASDGLHFVGRTAGVLDQAHLPALRATSRTFASISNQFVAGTPTDLVAPRLVVELRDGATTVHAAGSEGDRTGRATSADPQRAVVEAVLDASHSALVYRDAREVLLGQERAVLVVLTAPDGGVRPGFVVSEDDLLQSTAIATVRAVTGR